MLAFFPSYVKIIVMEMQIGEKKRIYLLDEIRGFAVFCMVFYHAFFILGENFGFMPANRLYEFFLPVEPLYAAIFIFVCGISCTLSRSNLKRGLKILGAAIGFSLVTCLLLPAIGIKGMEIYFGILHLLGVCVLIYAIGHKFFDKVSPYGGILACAVLYPFFSGIEDRTLGYGQLVSFKLPDVLYHTSYLMPLGIYSPWFYSADYFPVFPSVFIFFAGVFSGRILMKKGYPDFAYRKKIPFFDFLGKYSFIIYILHMPVIYGLAYVAEKIIY